MGADGVGVAVGTGELGGGLLELGGGLLELGAEVIVVVEFAVDDGMDAVRRRVEGLGARGGEVVD